MSPLDGKTILRFAHAFDSGGGTERYLDDLDRALLERNAATVVRLHLSRAGTRPAPQSRPIGRGTLITQGLPIVGGAPSASSPDEHGWRFRLRDGIRNALLYNPVAWPLVRRRLARRPLPLRGGQAIGAGAAAEEIMASRKVDLVVLHFFGGADADEILQRAKVRHIPSALINHYSNDRFQHLSIRKHAVAADVVGGVNGLQLPRYLRGRFHNVSDGIDLDFFRRDLARPLPDLPAEPVVLLPARVIREKGQLDLVHAAAALRRQGVACTLAFAGRVDASDYVDELQRELTMAGLSGHVRFLGNLSVGELRDWYAAAAVMAFPTYHHEGLGRVIVEAQAMATPVIAYATGGVPDAIVDGVTGHLVRTGDVGGLTDRLRELLASPARRAALGRAGCEAAQRHFSLAALAERHERYYLQALNHAS